MLSIGLHLILAYITPSLKFDTPKPPEHIEVELAPLKPPAPPKVEPEPIKPPEPVKPKIEPPPKVQPKLLPKPVLAEPTPIKSAEPPPIATPTVTAPTPPVMTAAPKAEATPVITAPVSVQKAEPAPTPSVSQEDIDDARNRYGNLLQQQIAKHKQYPKIAQMRGWQGEAELDLHLDGNGNVLKSSIKTSSGFEALDKQALEMVKKASPFPAPPDVLKGRAFNLTIPISFRLE